MKKKPFYFFYLYFLAFFVRIYNDIRKKFEILKFKISTILIFQNFNFEIAKYIGKLENRYNTFLLDGKK